MERGKISIYQDKMTCQLTEYFAIIKIKQETFYIVYELSTIVRHVKSPGLVDARSKILLI